MSKRDDLLIHVDQVHGGYIPEVNILNGCSLELAPGELIGIIGPNGAGKSTLLKALFGLVNVNQGHIYYEGDETRSRKIAKAIVDARRRAPFLRTAALAELVARTVGGGGKTHPATKTFQALRRAVNEEGDELLAALQTAENWLDAMTDPASGRCG